MATSRIPIFVNEIMRRSVTIVSPDDSLADAAKKMHEEDIGSLVVVKGRKIVGIITERDFVRITASRVDVKKVKVKEFMSKPVITCGPKDSIFEVALRMQKERVGHFPVVEKGKLVGIITSSDLVWYGIPVSLRR